MGPGGRPETHKISFFRLHPGELVALRARTQLRTHARTQRNRNRNRNRFPGWQHPPTSNLYAPWGPHGFPWGPRVGAPWNPGWGAMEPRAQGLLGPMGLRGPVGLLGPMGLRGPGAQGTQGPRGPWDLGCCLIYSINSMPVEWPSIRLIKPSA